MNSIHQLVHQLQTEFRLARFLGPWASRRRRPAAIVSRRLSIGPGHPADSILYAPRDAPPRGACLLSPGATPYGPDDPRMERFASVLAHAGRWVVLSPAIPNLMRHELRPRIIDDVRHAFDALKAQPEVPPGSKCGVFSVCVGSLGALRLAANPDYTDQISGLILFGGFGDPRAFIRALVLGCTGEDGIKYHDPLNQPVVFLTLLEHLPGAPEGQDAALLADAWRRYIQTAWKRPELKHADSTAHHRIAHAMAAGLPAAVRPLFLIGCGAEPGGHALCEAALDAPGNPYAFLDARRHIKRIRCPVHIIHSRLDAAVPFSQLAELARAMPPHVVAGLHPTTLFKHSSIRALGELLGHPTILLRELLSLARLLHGIASCAETTRR